jgi:hypothetical protein
LIEFQLSFVIDILLPDHAKCLHRLIGGQSMVRSFSCAVLLLAAPVYSQPVSLTFDTPLWPEDMGWIRIEQPEKLLADRVIEDGWFVQGPVVLPCPPLCTTRDHYRWYLTDQAGAEAWYLEWVMVTDGPPSFGAVAPSSMVAGGQSGILYHFTIGNNELAFKRGSQFPLVFHSFEPGIHHFRLELRNETPTGTYVFMFDGEVVDAGPAEGFYPTSESSVVFGVKAAVVDSETRWEYIEFGPFVPEPIPGDSDGDGDVDLTDYNFFEQCHSVSGPGVVPAEPGCLTSCDMDDDGDVDAGDFGGFQMAFTGAS